MNALVSADLAPAPQRAKAIESLLDADGAEIDRIHEGTPRAVDAIVGQDLLRMLLPKSLGGQEVHPADFAKTCEIVARGDASMGWFVNQSNVSVATSAAAMPEEAARTIFAGPSDGLAWGSKNNASKAIRVEGGYRLTGRWGYGSGSRHVKWIGAHSFVSNPDGSPHMRYGRHDDRTFLFPRASATITDDWDVLGLRGTGSDTYEVTDLFIPDAYAPARDAPEERVQDGPLYKIRSNLLYACGFSSVTIGIASKMLDTYIDLARKKHSRASVNSMASNHAVQQEIAKLHARVRSARAFLHEAINEAYDAAVADRLSLDERMQLRLATTNAMQEATEVSIACYKAGGTTAIQASEPFERRFRDAMSASQHLQGMNAHAEMVGRHLLGVDNVVQWV